MNEFLLEKIGKFTKVLACVAVAGAVVYRGQNYGDASSVSFLVPIMTVGFALCLGMTACYIALEWGDTEG